MCITNKDQKVLKVVSKEGFERGLVAQVADVNKTLLSLSRCVKGGHRMVCDEVSYILDKMTGERIWSEDVGGMCALEL